jgi:hypothetical protein
VVGRRLPIIVLTGPVDDLKARLANFLLNTSASSYALVSETAMSDLIASVDQSPKDLERFTVDGCLCCIGAVTLMAQITRFLRSQRRENKYQGLLLVAGTQTKSAVLIDQLRQPVLADLVEVSAVVYAASELLLTQAEEVTVADIVFLNQKHLPSLQALSAGWLYELPGSQERVFTTDVGRFHDLTKLKGSVRYEAIWPAEKTFDRRNLQNLLAQAAKDGLCFDAVFRTQRAWYRWRVLSATKHLSPMLETTYRRQSYLHWYPAEGALTIFNTLKSGIGNED